MSKRQTNLFHLRKILSIGFGRKIEMRLGGNFVLPFPRIEGYAQELPLFNKSYIFLDPICVLFFFFCTRVRGFNEVYLFHIHEKRHM